MRRSHGGRQHTRCILKKNYKNKGKITINKQLQEFNIGDKVVIKPEPAIQRGMPFRRFFGKVGVIVAKRGKAYEIEIMDIPAKKTVMSLPVHLQKR